MMAQQKLIQKIEHLRTGEEFDLSFLTECVFVETLDLSGPRLMMEFDDSDTSYLRESLGVVAGDKVRVTLADMFSQDGMDLLMNFTILTMPIAGNSVKFNAILSDVYDLKQPRVTPKLFVRKAPSYILKTLFPGLKYDLARALAVEDYHISVGERPSYMLKQMAREQGAHIYVSRDYVCLKRISELMSQSSPDFEYSYGDVSQPNQIIQYQTPRVSAVLTDLVAKRYSGWSITDGVIKSGKNTSYPAARYPSASRSTLDHLAAVSMPVIDLSCMGNGYLCPGKVVDVTWNTNMQEAPIDESLPARFVTSLVAHSYRANKYFCRAKGVVAL